MNTSKINDLTWCAKEDPEYNHTNDYLTIWQYQSLFKMLFCVLARHAITPICFRNLAKSCKTGRDACRQFAAMKKHLFLSSVKCGSSTRQFLPNGLCHGVFRSRYYNHYYDRYYENGIELYRVSQTHYSDKLIFRSFEYLIRKVELVGRLVIKNKNTSFLGGPVIIYLNIHNEGKMKAYKCNGCGQICTFTWKISKDINIYYHRKCRAGELFKFYRQGQIRPRTVKCAILLYTKCLREYGLEYLGY